LLLCSTSFLASRAPLGPSSALDHQIHTPPGSQPLGPCQAPALQRPTGSPHLRLARHKVNGGPPDTDPTVLPTPALQACQIATPLAPCIAGLPQEGSKPA
jgi:hypothetical protein